METKGLGAGSYPEPKEEKTKLINIHINIKYAINDLEVPSKWSFEDIQEDFKQNMVDYITNAEIEDFNITMKVLVKYKINGRNKEGSKFND